ncbi:MAG: hypothetical protein GXY83_20860 [Rhodopirellula sp.]|nr:hypothetical protein [Rhodopirellula sp.]
MTHTKKTSLTVEAEYDPAATDPEGLACAMDRLLKTALSTPGIMDEYNNPGVGEFFVAPETSVPPEPKVVLNISGGVLQDVFSSDPAIAVTLVDWDTDGSARSDDGVVEISNERGGTQLAAVAECPVSPLADLAGTKTEAALKAAGLDWATDDADDNRCECEEAGFFCSGVPGILAHLENGRLPEGAKVNRCDLCRRYPSDEAAFEKLRKLGLVPP